eukprot:1020057-Pyramimonas_sp.AAC.1
MRRIADMDHARVHLDWCFGAEGPGRISVKCIDLLSVIHPLHERRITGLVDKLLKLCEQMNKTMVGDDQSVERGVPQVAFRCEVD